MLKLRYWLGRINEAVDVYRDVVVRKGMAPVEAQKRLMEQLSTPLSFSLPMTGTAMSPTLNNGVGNKETLWIRRILQASERNVFLNDVVVLIDPHDERRKYVRRVTAMPGEELVSDRPEDEPIVLPPNHCWVSCDNEKGKPDSRFFGPLNFDKVIGRVIYAMRSATDHSRIVNSQKAMELDDIILAVEQPLLQSA
mmetsp:Transcript_4456/g.7811  ORF Transcript_4456/g.7811 Transcript_4456/m.7811 type:complete len:195 (-) Transcript_4456:292-876(-)